MDPYRTLGVQRDAEPALITRSYRALLIDLHPDTRRDLHDASRSADRLAEVLAAYALLRDPDRRAAYDREHPAPPRDHTAIPVRVRHSETTPLPDLRVGPVRHHPS